MPGKTATRANEKFGAYRPSENADTTPRAAQTNNMLAKLGEASYFNEYRRTFIHDMSGARRPEFFLRPDNLQPGANSRTSQVRRLRRLEKRQLWLQNLAMFIVSFFYGIKRFNPFRSYADQTRFSGRGRPQPKEPAKLVPRQKKRRRAS